MEEAGLPYSINSVTTSSGEQFAPDLLKNSPYNRIPARVDNDPADRNGELKNGYRKISPSMLHNLNPKLMPHIAEFMCEIMRRESRLTTARRAAEIATDRGMAMPSDP